MSDVELDEDDFVVDVQSLGDPKEFCQGHLCNIPIGACRLRRNFPLSEYVCLAENDDGKVCGAKFEDDDEQQHTESFVHPYAPDPSLFLDESKIVSDQSDDLQELKDKVDELIEKVDIIIEFLQKNVQVQSRVIDANIDKIIDSPWLEPPTELEVCEELRVIIDDAKKRSLNLTIDSIRGMINKRFGTRYKNIGIQKLINQCGFDQSNNKEDV